MGYLYNLKKYFTFSNSEIWNLILIIFIYGSILGYNDGYEKFYWARWSFNYFTSLLMVAIVLLTHEVGRKAMAIKKGYTVEFQPWWRMVVVSSVLAFFSNGIIEVLLPATGMFITHHKKLRIGKFRFGQNYYDNAFIAFFGCYANILMAIFLKAFSFLPNQELILTLMQLNIWYAIINLLPLDIVFVLWRLEKADIRKHPAPFDGTYMFYASRIFYAFCIGTIILTSFILSFFNILASVIIGVFLGILVSIVYGAIKENMMA